MISLLQNPIQFPVDYTNIHAGSRFHLSAYRTLRNRVCTTQVVLNASLVNVVYINNNKKKKILCPETSAASSDYNFLPFFSWINSSPELNKPVVVGLPPPSSKCLSCTPGSHLINAVHARIVRADVLSVMVHSWWQSTSCSWIQPLVRQWLLTFSLFCLKFSFQHEARSSKLKACYFNSKMCSHADHLDAVSFN